MNTFIAKPIASLEEGKTFIEQLHASGKMFHFEDSPDDIVMTDGSLLFPTTEEQHEINKRIEELYALDWSSLDHECPIGYALDVMRERNGRKLKQTDPLQTPQPQ